MEKIKFKDKVVNIFAHPMAKIVGRCDLCGEVIYNSEPDSIELGECVYCINNKNDTFERYGRTWYHTRPEAEKHRQPPQTKSI